MRTTRTGARALALGTALVFTLLILACGGGSTVTPTKVGEVGSTGDPTAPATIQGEAAPVAEPTTAAVEPTAPAPASYAIGDIIALKDLRMVVLGWSAPEPTEYIKPDPDNQFVAVDLLVVNAGDRPASISSLLQMTLKDDTGQAYDLDIGAIQAAGKAAPDGTLVPGERMRGTVAFQIPTSASGLTFVYDADVFGAGKLFVTLGDQPAAVDVPAQIEGERAPEAAQVGETLTLDAIKLTVNQAERTQGEGYAKPGDGQVFVIVDITLENTGAEAANVSSLAQAALKDATGQVYKIDISATMAAQGKSPDGELAPGEKLRGPIGFQVPADAEGLQFVYLADIFGGEKVFVQLPD